MNTPTDIIGVIHSLNKVAAKNKDRFFYKLIPDVCGSQIVYHFQCYEAADGHIFVDGVGYNPDVAALNAYSVLVDCAEAWGYVV